MPEPQIVRKLSSDLQRILQTPCEPGFIAWIEKMYLENRELCGIAELSGPGPGDDGDVSDATASQFLFFIFFSDGRELDGRCKEQWSASRRHWFCWAKAVSGASPFTRTPECANAIAFTSLPS